MCIYIRNIYSEHTRNSLFIKLSIVDLLLHSVIGYQSIHITVLLLAIAIHPTHSLGVVARVPRGIKYYHSVRTYQVNTQTTSSEMYNISYV